jgi:hypothetical protein
VSHRIRASLTVLAAGWAVVWLVRRVGALEQDLRAERAGRRLVDHVVHADHQRELQLARAAAMAGGPVPSTSQSTVQEGGHQ